MNPESVADTTSDEVNKKDGDTTSTVRTSCLLLCILGYNLPPQMSKAKSDLQMELQRKRFGIPKYKK